MTTWSAYSLQKCKWHRNPSYPKSTWWVCNHSKYLTHEVLLYPSPQTEHTCWENWMFVLRLTGYCNKPPLGDDCTDHTSPFVRTSYSLPWFPPYLFSWLNSETECNLISKFHLTEPLVTDFHGFALVLSTCPHLHRHEKPNQKHHVGTSLVAQWVRICLPMQGTQVQPLVWEDFTCHGETEPVRHNYWARALEPRSATTEPVPP